MLDSPVKVAKGIRLQRYMYQPAILVYAVRVVAPSGRRPLFGAPSDAPRGRPLARALAPRERMETGGSRAALKRARKKQNKARPPHPERRDPPPAAASSDQVVGKKRDKRKDKRAAKRKLQEVEAADDEPDELEGIVVDGELLLRDPSSGAVYASERDERGALVAVGRWEAGKLVPLAVAPD